MPYYDPKDVMRSSPTAQLSDETIAQIAIIKGAGQRLWSLLDQMPQSADMTLAKRKVEEAVMWATKAVTA